VSDATIQTKPTGARRLFWLLVVLIATGSLSNFFRASNAVIAPELIRDLGLSPQMLGTANSAFFIALLVLQVPLGVMFDRIGVRWSVAMLSVPMTAGAALHALADGGGMLIAARFLVGLGCAGSFMASVVLVPRFVPRDRWSTMLGLVFACSQLGYFMAGVPLAYMAETIGWRRGFLGVAVLSGLVGLAVYACVRDHPDGHSPGRTDAPAGPGTLDGLRQIWSTPGIPHLFALFSVSYASLFTIVGLWIGPYLRDVHGFDAVARGHVLTLVALTLLGANMLIGPLDRWFGAPKRLVIGLACCALAVFAALAMLTRPPAWLAVGLLLALCAVSSYGPIVLAQIRARVPDHLAGRGATSANIAQLMGTSALPILTGFVPPLFETPVGGGYAEAAYRTMFVLVAVVLAAGLAGYARLPIEQSKPAATPTTPIR
jgi:predicted MFS family arabinose efflux permease